MASEPPEDAIASFLAITNTTRDKAVSFLKANNCDSNRAINAYFENPNSVEPEPQVGWPVSQELPYSYQNQNVSSFSIESSDVPDPRSYGTAPSRPPSRIGSRDYHNGMKMGQPLEMPAEQSATAGTGTKQGMSLAEQEEHEIQQAMAMSLNTDLRGGEKSTQETGVVRSDNTHFGPATRDHYEETSWALTLMEPQAREAQINPNPEERKRVDDEPVFIRPSEEADYLPALITILHAIPLAREALLLRDRVASDYGYDPQWWNGQSINLPKVVSLGNDDSADNSDWDDILLETQRLMAFLNSTDRAFGSTDALSSLRSVRGSDPDLNIARFFESWQNAAVYATPNNQLATVFSSLVLKRPLYADEDPIDREFFTARLSCDAESCETLYDVLDTSVWADRPGMELDDVWLDRIGEVFTLQLSSSDVSRKSLGVKIPAVWYPDRYLDSCKEFARNIRARRLEVYGELDRLQELTDRLSISSASASSNTPLRNVLEKAYAGSLVALQTPTTSGPAEVQHTHEESQKLANELKTISDKIDEKLKALEERRKHALESLKTYTHELTTPSDSPNDPPYHKYTLRGICTHPHVTYVLKRCRDKTKNSEEDIENGRRHSKSWQWWRISFSVEDAKSRLAEEIQKPASQVQSSQDETQRLPMASTSSYADVAGYTARRVREVEVLRAAKEESPNVLLIYANENAVNYEDDVIPGPLQTFVDTDNESLNAEIQEARKAQNISQQPTSTSQSDPSGDSNKAEVYEEADPNQSNNPSNQEPVNVFDYEVSSFSEGKLDDKLKDQEMQEREGPGLLAQTGQRISGSSSSMMGLQDEVGDTPIQRTNPAA